MKASDEFKENHQGHLRKLTFGANMLKKDFDSSDEVRREPSIWVQLTKWGKHRCTPSYGAMRNVVARRNENGAWEFLSLVNGRFYVNLAKFDAWMEKQKGGVEV